MADALNNTAQGSSKLNVLIEGNKPIQVNEGQELNMPSNLDYFTKSKSILKNVFKNLPIKKKYITNLTAK